MPAAKRNAQGRNEQQFPDMTVKEKGKHISFPSDRQISVLYALQRMGSHLSLSQSTQEQLLEKAICARGAPHGAVRGRRPGSGWEHWILAGPCMSLHTHLGRALADQGSSAPGIGAQGTTTC